MINNVKRKKIAESLRSKAETIDEEFIEPNEYLKNEILNEQEERENTNNNNNNEQHKYNDDDEKDELLIEKLRALDGKKRYLILLDLLFSLIFFFIFICRIKNFKQKTSHRSSRQRTGRHNK